MVSAVLPPGSRRHLGWAFSVPAAVGYGTLEGGPGGRATPAVFSQYTPAVPFVLPWTPMPVLPPASPKTPGCFGADAKVDRHSEQPLVTVTLVWVTGPATTLPPAADTSGQFRGRIRRRFHVPEPANEAGSEPVLSPAKEACHPPRRDWSGIEGRIAGTGSLARAVSPS